MGPAAKYQEAFYVYEEMRGMQGGRTEDVLGGVGVAQAAMGRWEESTSAVAEGLEAVSLFYIDNFLLTLRH
jgi:coatomer protein complex subunit epsilon